MLSLHPEKFLDNVDMWDGAGEIWNWAFYVSQGTMISIVKAKLFWSLEFWAGIWSEISPEKSLCSWNPIFAKSPYPIEVTIVIKAKAWTIATVMQPAVNLQNTSDPTQAFLRHLYNWGEQHLGSQVFHLWPQKSAVPCWLCSMSPFVVQFMLTRMNSESELFGMWALGAVSLQCPWSGLPESDKNPMTTNLINAFLPCRWEPPSSGLSSWC